MTSSPSPFLENINLLPIRRIPKVTTYPAGHGVLTVPWVLAVLGKWVVFFSHKSWVQNWLPAFTHECHGPKE